MQSQAQRRSQMNANDFRAARTNYSVCKVRVVRFGSSEGLVPNVDMLQAVARGGRDSGWMNR